MQDELARAAAAAAAQMKRDLDEISPKELEARWEAKRVERLQRDGQAHEERREQRKVAARSTWLAWCIPSPMMCPCHSQLRYKERLLEITALKKLQPDEALIHWMNYQLKQASSEDTLPKRILNFSSDVADAEAWGIVLSQVAWTPNSFKVLAARDTSMRCELVHQELRDLKPDAVNFTTAEHIASGDAPINMALAARLMCTHSGLQPGSKSIDQLHHEVDELVATFKGLGESMRAMHFSAHRWEEAESLELEMRDFGSTKRKVRGKDIWRGKGVGNSLRNVADMDASVIDTALDT